MADYVAIFDTTLRDGEQSPGASMNAEEKIRMALQLERLGVDFIEYRSREETNPGWDQKDDLYFTFRREIDPSPEVNLN